MKHVNRNSQGVWKYRRRVPGDIVDVIGKIEFKGTLGNSHNQALSAWPKFHAQIEQQIARARKAKGAAGNAVPPSARDAYADALRQFRVELARVPDGDYDREDMPSDPLGIMADSILAGYPEDPLTGEPTGVPLDQSYLVNFLRTRGKAARPAATLGDALKEYVKERYSDDRAGSDKTAIASAERAVRLVISALGKDPVLEDLTRDDAKEARDFMLDRFKANGQKVSVSTVDRELNNVRAVVNFALAEGLMPAGLRNVFERLSMPMVANGSTEAEKRDPLPASVLAAVSLRVSTAAAQDMDCLWRMLAGTGCRLSEIAGLRREDVVLDAVGDEPLPHIRVAWHENRRLKTQSSIRCVPLVGDALEAAKTALALSQGTMLFPRYGRLRGGDAASQALMKHIRKVTTNPKHVVHSLRHNMKDRLELAQTPELVRNLIMGWSLDSVGNRVYGGETAKLIETTRAMRKAFSI